MCLFTKYGYGVLVEEGLFRLTHGPALAAKLPYALALVKVSNTALN